ncbi:MAG: hypothetical protein QOE71_3905, partial [Pseudonocardiales bacterium]|nr:hypothetical protein [Pseudonocardiales bacterium]
NGEVIRAYKRAHQHVVGARETADAPTVVRAPGTSGAGWVIQVKLHVQAGKIVDSGGKALQLQQVSSQLVNLYLKWETRMWRVQQDVLAQ